MCCGILFKHKAMAHWSSGQDASLSRWKLGFDSRMGHQKSKQHIARCAVCFFVIFLRNCTAFALAQYARVRIPHPKIDKLACRGLGVGIFAHCAKFPIFSNIARCAVCFFVIFLRNCMAFALAQYARVRIPHPKIDKLACQTQGVGIFAHRAKFPILQSPRTECFFRSPVTHPLISPPTMQG